MLDENEPEGDSDNRTAKEQNEEEEDHAFPPGSDRLDDILDEID